MCPLSFSSFLADICYPQPTLIQEFLFGCLKKNVRFISSSQCSSAQDGRLPKFEHSLQSGLLQETTCCYMAFYFLLSNMIVYYTEGTPNSCNNPKISKLGQKSSLCLCVILRWTDGVFMDGWIWNELYLNMLYFL